MKSEEINERRLKGFPRPAEDSEPLWEIAYQLALMNEKPVRCIECGKVAEVICDECVSEKKRLADPGPGKRDAVSEPGECAVLGCKEPWHFQFCGIWLCKQHQRDISIQLKDADFGKRDAASEPGTLADQIGYILESCAKTIIENSMDAWKAADYLRAYKETVLKQSGKRDSESSVAGLAYDCRSNRVVVKGHKCCYSGEYSSHRTCCICGKDNPNQPGSRVSEPSTETSFAPQKDICPPGKHVFNGTPTFNNRCIVCHRTAAELADQRFPDEKPPTARYEDYSPATKPQRFVPNDKLESPSWTLDKNWKELYDAVYALLYREENHLNRGRLLIALQACTPPKES